MGQLHLVVKCRCQLTAVFDNIASKAGREELRRALFTLLFASLSVYGQKSLSLADQAKVLTEVRENALNYSRALPDYSCRQVTTRDHEMVPMLWATNNPGVAGKEPPRWKQEDVIEEDLVARARNESYSNMKINGMPAVNPTHEQLQATVAYSTYSWFLEHIFSSTTSIHWAHFDRLHGRRMMVFVFEAPESQGLPAWDRFRGIQAKIVVPYKGLLYADAESKMIVRIEVHAAGFPERSRYAGLDLVLDYTRVRWEGHSVIVPEKFEVHWRSKIATDTVTLLGGNSRLEEERTQALRKAHKAGDFSDLIPEETNTYGEFKGCRPLAGGESEAPKLLKP